MQKRQLRLSGVTQIRTHLAQLVGKKINIVLLDNTVIFGELTQIHTASIEVLNMRFRKIKVPIDQVYEIYLDVDA